MAICYLEGWGGPVDRAALAREIRSAAEFGYAPAQRILSDLYALGFAVPLDRAESLRWLERAAESGDAQAPYILAVCELLHLDSPDRNDDRARHWLKEAAARGNPSAMEVLKLEKSGESLAAAMTHVLSVPSAQRYVEQVNTEAKIEADKPKRKPVVIRVVEPTYPESLRLTATKGEAVVQFTVDQAGQVLNPKVVRATHPLFGERAIEAVLQWRFRPGVREGRTVMTPMEVPVFFDPKTADLSGIDGLVGFPRQQAKRLGRAAEEDAKDLSLAKPPTPPPYPVMPDNRPSPEGAMALVMIVIDSKGVPLRGYVLHAKPEELGPVVLAAGLSQPHHPRVREDQVATSRVLLSFQAKPSEENPNVFRTVSSGGQ